MVLPDTVKVYFSPLQGHYFKISVITRKAFLKAICSTSAQLIGYYMDHHKGPVHDGAGSADQPQRQ